MPRLAAWATVALAGGWSAVACSQAFAQTAPSGWTTASLYPPIRAAAVRRDVADVGYFKPLADPPRTQAALDQIVEFDAIDAPLDQIFAGLERSAGVRFVLDAPGFEQSALTTDVEITFRSAGMPLGVALRAMLRELDLVIIPRDEYVFVTSRETGEWMVETRLYALVDHPLLRKVSESQLVDAIRKLAEPESHNAWHTMKVNVLPGAVAISATQENHARAADLLRQYGRFLAEYDAATTTPDEGASGWPVSAESPDSFQMVQRTGKRRDPSAYFRETTERTKTASALDRPADFDIDYLPAQEFVVELERLVGVPFRLDGWGLQLAKKTPDVPLTFRAEGLSYAAALSLMLAEQGLRYVPQRDYVLITALEDERYQVSTRSYATLDHPLLRGDGATHLLLALRRHIAEEEADYSQEFGIQVQDGILTIAADDEMLAHADAFLTQYGRLLAEFDIAQDLDTPREAPQALSSSAVQVEGRLGLRPMMRRRWTEFALQQRVSVDLVDMPLEKICVRLEQDLGVPFVLDHGGLEQAAVTSDVVMSFRARGESYAAALSRMLAERDLRYVIRERYVDITSRETEKWTSETRIYAILHPPNVSEDEDKPLRWLLYDYVETFDRNYYENEIRLLPGILAVTASQETLAKIEAYLGRYGLAPPEYDLAKPTPPPPLPSSFRRFVPRPPDSVSRTHYLAPGADDPFALRDAKGR